MWQGLQCSPLEQTASLNVCLWLQGTNAWHPCADLLLKVHLLRQVPLYTSISWAALLQAAAHLPESAEQLNTADRLAGHF